ncbi:MAG: hypothetical protein Q8O16_00205 [Dehalococcoidia bacterium]|nr:hypothetical protein [Dehalococcoidia bacterium]
MTEGLTKREQIFGIKKQRTLVYNPTSVPVTEKIPRFAPRINAFDGKRIGLYWNGKPNGDFYLNRVAELLEKRYKDIKIIKFWEVDPKETAHPDKKSDAALDRMAKSSDVVIASQGD